MAFGIGDELSVRVSAQTRDFERGINQAQNSLSNLNTDTLQTAAAMQILSNRTDEAGDQMNQTAGSASAASASVSALGVSSSASAVGLGSIAAAATLAVGALASLAAVAVVVGGALAAIVGAGFIAFGQQAAAESEEATTAMEGLALVAKDLKQDLMPILTRLGRDLIPAIRDGIRGLPDLLRDTVDAFGGMDNVTRLLRAAGRGVSILLPQLSRLASVALQELGPELGNLGRALIRLLPQLTRTGIVVAQVLLPPLTAFLNTVTAILTEFNRLPMPVKQFITVAGALATVLLALVPLVGVGGLAGALGGVASAGSSAAFSLTSLGSAFTSLLTISSAVTAGAVGIGAAIGGIGVQALDSAGALDTLRKEGIKAGNVLGEQTTNDLLVLASVLSGGLLPVVTTVGAAIVGYFENGIPGAINHTLEALSIIGEAFIDTFNRIAKSFNRLLSVVGGGQLNLLSGSGMNVNPSQTIQSGGSSQSIDVTVENRIEGELPEDSIRDVSTDVVAEERRRANRLRDRGTGI